MPSPSDIREREHTTLPQGSMPVHCSQRHGTLRALSFMLEESVCGAKHGLGQAPVCRPWLALWGKLSKASRLLTRPSKINQGTCISSFQWMLCSSKTQPVGKEKREKRKEKEEKGVGSADLALMERLVW